MAPAVIGLEISRLDRALNDVEPGTADYNTLVRARYEMKQFAAGLERAAKQDLEQRADHLRRALLAVSLTAGKNDTLQYVTRRLHYVHDRLQLIY